MKKNNLRDVARTTVSTIAAVLTAALLSTAFFGVAGAQQLAQSDPYQNSIVISSDPDVPEDVLARHIVALGADDLKEVADIWQRRVQTNLARIAADVTRLDTVGEDKFPDVVAEIKATNQKNVGYFQNYLIVVYALARKGGPKDEVKKHQDFIKGFIGELLLSYQWTTIAHLSWDWVRSGKGGLRVLSGLIQAIAVLTVAFFLGGALKRASDKWLRARDEGNEVAAVVVPNVIRWGVLLIGFLFALWGLGVNIGVTTAVIGGFGFLLAFMMQNLFQSVIGGFLLQATNPYAKGDIISVDQIIGTVIDVNLISTKLRTFDNRLIQIPNQSIWQGSMESLTKYRVRRVDLVFGIGYKDDIETAKAILYEMVEEDKRCLKSPEARVFVGELGPSSVNIFCRPWVRTDDYWDVQWDLTEIGKTRLQNKGIFIAYPQMDVHVHTRQEPSGSD